LTQRLHFAAALAAASAPTTYVPRPCLRALHACLQAVLARQLPEGVLHQRAAFDRYEESEDGVTIHFQQAAPSSDGGGSDSAPSPVTARMLVGADGGQSAVRAQCIGDGPPLFLGA
jgi:2-polyprenyl-6-methoxyphenol hydroxylase-like FAD-dependent oxidoreductase